METVKLNISIHIDTSGDVDTGLTVEQWNALTDAERGKIYGDNWDAMAQSDDGGACVLTPGAKEI